MIGVFILADYAFGPSLCHIAVNKALWHKQPDFLSRFNEAALAARHKGELLSTRIEFEASQEF